MAHRPTITLLEPTKEETMTRILAAFFAVVLTGGALVGSAWAEVPDAEQTLITDPDVLESMGFPRDAQNVYMLNRAWKATAAEPVEFGFGTDNHFTPVDPKSFIGRQDTAAGPWEYNGGFEGCCENLSRLGVEMFADAQIHLPTGVNINAFRWWANDTNATSDIAIFIFRACHPGFGPGPTVTTIIAQASPATTGATGNQSSLLSGPQVTVDNQSCRYKARVRFDATTGLTLQKVRLQWQRQVSPPPAVAQFSDVPTTHPQFRFVEALVAAGITGGCGGGNYCPDNPLTRGQMAVFLSVALGLNFP
jgi:hypothetical protein